MGRSVPPFPTAVTRITDGEAVGEVQYLTTAAALFGEVSLTQGVLDVTVESYTCFDGLLGVGEELGELEAQPEVE
jgi:hypothetical protein